jgi:hypothetical protein
VTDALQALTDRAPEKSSSQMTLKRMNGADLSLARTSS